MERLVKNQRKDGQKKLFSEERLDGKIFGSDFLTKQNEINEKKRDIEAWREREFRE